MNFYKNLEKFSVNTALIMARSESVRYSELLDMADTLGAHIPRRCLVMALCKNSCEALAGYLGFMRANVVVILVNPGIHGDFLATLLRSYRPAYVYLPQERSAEVSSATTVTTMGDYALLQTDSDSDYAIHDDLALLLTTSGSTGGPKFVRLSSENLESNAAAIVQYLGITSADRPMTTMPMGYSYGLSIINSHLLAGATLVLNDATLMEKNFWETVRKHDVTMLGGVPYIYEMLKKLRFSRMDLPSLRYMTQAGGKLGPELTAEFAEVCGQKGVRFYVMYGQTEATARISYLPCALAKTKAGSIGMPIPGGDLWIEDDDGVTITAEMTPGELVYKGKNVSLGYAEGYADLAEGDHNRGILRTGDLAQRDAEGFYYIVGRKKRFLKMYGNRINLDEVEQMVRGAGYDCACAGTDDNLKVYVTKLDDPSRIKTYISERTGIHHSGFNIVTIDEIPRSDSGKVLYSELD